MEALGTPPAVALALLGGAIPVGLWVAVSDLSRMRIPNRAVLALVAAFAVLGLAMVLAQAWTLGDWGWRWANLGAMLLAGLALNAVGGVGAGDAKFAAAAAPFVAARDWPEVAMILAAALLLAWAGHRLARATVGPALAPEWRSWSSGKRFPMGVALAGTLVAYLLLCALG